MGVWDGVDGKEVEEEHQVERERDRGGREWK